MARKRLTRRELVEKDDITTGLQSATGYVVEHGKPIAIGVGVAILIAAIVVVFRVSAANRTAAAEEALAQVIQAYSQIDEGRSDEERFQAAASIAARVQADHPREPVAEIARYYEALSYKGLGNIDEAASILDELAQTAGPTTSAIARFALAELYREEGELELAVEAYRGLADREGYAQEAALYELGRLHEELSMPNEARDYYESLVGTYPNSAFRPDADRALRRLTPPGTDEDS